MKLQPLDTTVPGSFPVFPFYPVHQDFPPYTDEIPDGEVYLDDPFLPGVFEALRLQQKAGIDYPSYGQPHDMCAMFLGYLVGKGLSYEKGFHVVGDIELPEKIPAIEYLKVAKEYFSFKGVRMPLTGPITLSSVLKVGEKSAVEYPEIIEKLAQFVARIARSYDEGGASIICIDEPSLVYGLYIGLEPNFLIEMINTSLRMTTAVPSIHVCGQLNTAVTDVLLSTKAVVLDHEFASIPGNLSMYTKEVLESCGKSIGCGCVVSNMEPSSLMEIQKDGDWRRVVEPVPVIKKRIEEASALWGKENIILDPDCGFGGLRGYIRGELTREASMNICFEKLSNMVKAKKEVQ